MTLNAGTRLHIDRVVQELARIGFSDVRRLFGQDGHMKPINALDPDAAAAIADIDTRGADDDQQRRPGRDGGGAREGAPGIQGRGPHGARPHA